MTADMRRVPTTDMHVMLTGQRMYTQYQVTLLAFNAAAGDGPNMSRPLEARTNEGGRWRDLFSAGQLQYNFYTLSARL